MTMIEFSCTKEERALIGKIIKRMNNICRNRHIPEFEYLTLSMDLEACHSNRTPLDFEKLFKFDDANLMHDVCGIDRHINRETGKLEGFFLPRCAKPSKKGE